MRQEFQFNFSGVCPLGPPVPDVYIVRRKPYASEDVDNDVMIHHGCRLWRNPGRREHVSEFLSQAVSQT